MSYGARIDAAEAAEKWPLTRKFLLEEPHAFFHEMRETRPVLALPELTLAFRFADCAAILRRHNDFGVDLYRPKQGDYFMAQDDTPDHWRDKSIMRSVLDFEQVPEIRNFVAAHTAELLNRGRGAVNLPAQITRAVPVAVVQRFFGLSEGKPEDLIDWSYWNQQDAFHNQPFDSPAVSDARHIEEMRKRANVRLAIYMGRLVAKRLIKVKLGGGAQDPVSRLLRLSFSGGVRFPLKKVLFNSGGLLIGAVETTSHAVNNVIAELFDRPQQLKHAQEAARGTDPAEVDRVALEALRFRPAFPYFFRTCHRPTFLAAATEFAHKVTTGTTVLAVTHSAMFDASAFPDPNAFDPSRSQDDNFTFGQGLHECLGRALARPMIGEIVRQILRLPGLRPAGPVEFRGGVPESFPVAWQA